MKLTNEMKTKVENLLNKTGLDIELIENESNWEGVYYYQLKVHPVSIYVNVTGAVRFTEKFWYDLNKIIKGAGFHVYSNEKKNAFVVTERESLNVGTYKGGMEYWDGTTDGESYVFVEENEESVLVLNDLNAVSKLQKQKFRIYDKIAL